ncbi:OMP decarboxylase [Dirofilaria immitis]|nr:OMP decarboxylase [Dirofilaria immitis]
MSDSQTLSYSRSLTDIRIEQGYHLDQLRSKLSGLDMRDLVPQLVARHVLRSQEMSAVYSEEKREDQVDKLIEILKTKNHWLGPLIDALIRNGQATLAKELLAASITPKEAIDSGADYIVIGRPITMSGSPTNSVELILKSLTNTISRTASLAQGQSVCLVNRRSLVRFQHEAGKFSVYFEWRKSKYPV